jgi:hypothetical protein
MNQDPSHSSKPQREITVPRVQPTDDKLPKEPMPSPDTTNARDEDYANAGKPLVADSREAKALHENPPRAKGELGVGTAGDAARPTKMGIHDKPIPPRQSLPRG